MRRITWSQNKQGTWTGKVGPVTLFTIAWHTGFFKFYMFPKLPGIKSTIVRSVGHGKEIAEKHYEEFCNLLGVE